MRFDNKGNDRERRNKVMWRRIRDEKEGDKKLKSKGDKNSEKSRS